MRVLLYTVTGISALVLLFAISYMGFTSYVLYRLNKMNRKRQASFQMT